MVLLVGLVLVAQAVTGGRLCRVARYLVLLLVLDLE